MSEQAPAPEAAEAAQPVDGGGGDPAPQQQTPQEPAPQPAPQQAPQPAEQDPLETIRNLRHENEKYRKRWQPIEQTLGDKAEVFTKLPENDRNALLDLAAAHATAVEQGDTSRAQQLVKMFAEHYGVAAAEQQPAEDQPVTRAEMQRMIEEREAEAAERREREQALANVNRQLDQWGIGPGSELEMIGRLAALEHYRTGVPLEQAHQQVIEQALQAANKVTEMVQATGGQYPPASPGTSPQPTEQQAEGDTPAERARNSARRYLRSKATATPGA